MADACDVQLDFDHDAGVWVGFFSPEATLFDPAQGGWQFDTSWSLGGLGSGLPLIIAARCRVGAAPAYPVTCTQGGSVRCLSSEDGGCQVAERYDNTWSCTGRLVPSP